VQTPPKNKGVKKNILHDRDWFSGSPRLDIMSMSRIVDEVLAANHAYSESFGAKGQFGMPPARRFAILTCMDARLDPARFAGLGEGDAHVIRNAGGRASDDAIRSLVISYKLLAHASGSSSFIPTVGWKRSRMKSSAACCRGAWSRR
jgi:hypothetical protein